METSAEKGLRETRAAMGADASLLQYLPVEKIYEAIFEDKKRERPNSLPLRILFGQLIEDDKKGEEVWILLNKSCAEDRWPEHRFNIFDRTGRLLGGISVEDAVRQTNPANAFKCLKPSGIMDIAHLRAVVKYYFMIKKVDPQMPWPVNALFASQLVAACKVARKFAEKVANNNQTEKENKSATNETFQKRPSITALQAAKTNTPTNQLREETTTPANGPGTDAPLALNRVQSMPNRTSMRSASTQPTRPLCADDDSDSLFVPEQPRRAATPHSFKPRVPRTAPTDLFSEPDHVEEYRRAFQKKMLPQPAVTPRSPPSGPRSNRHSFAVHQDANRVNNTAPLVTPKPVSEDKAANSPLTSKVAKRKNVGQHHQSPVTFVAAYRKADAEGEAYKTKLQDNETKIRETKAEIAALETRLRDLEVEERNLKTRHKDTQISKKRLHDELTPENRELLRFGVELAEREFKRLKTGAHEHVDGDEWRITQELGCGQKE